MGQKHQSNVKTSAAREAEKELAAREKSEDILVRISKEMSEMTDEQLKSVFDLYEISKKYEKQIAEN
jgi:hypothetical protein